MDKSKLEDMLGELVKSGVDMSTYWKTPTKLVISPYLLKVAESILENNQDKHEVEVKFDE